MDAAVYCRISRDRQGSGLGVARQLADCRALAKERRWKVIEELTDDDLSAFSGKHRPAYADLLAGITQGRYGAVVAWHPDRLHRSPTELEEFITVVEAAGCAVVTCRAGEVDLSTAAGRMSARVVGAVARSESEQKSERLTRKHQELAEHGRWKGGPRPYGYRVMTGKGTLEPVTAEAAVIRSAARRVLAGETVYAIVRDLNQQAVPTATGAAWRPPTLRRILTNPTTAGLREYRGEVVGPAVWDPILDPALRAKLVTIIDDPSRARGKVPRVALLASGLARCGRCGSKLITQRRANGARVYVCLKGPVAPTGDTPCGRLSVQAEPLEAVVEEALLIRMDGPALSQAMTSKPDDSGAAEELAGVEHRLEELADMFASGEIDRAGFLRARRGLEARQEAALAAVRRSQRLTALDGVAESGALRKAWPELNLDRRRAIAAAIIDRVTIAPATRRGRTFDTDRIDVDWRA